ncbi:MAG TPA: hypothetical protein DDX92_11285 [Flavobacteriales bacterium]|jgi:hypothetical protein|nr:hypothetical protein [Flavobacteriales bacterium]
MHHRQSIRKFTGYSFSEMKIFAVILIFLYCTPSIVRFVTIGDYLVRQDYYAQELCENKDKPITSCNGKCQIESIFEENKNNDQKPNLPSTTTKALEIEAVLNRISHLNCILQVSLIKLKPYTDVFLYSDFINQIFVPPELNVKII